MKNIFLEIEYLGINYFGFQIQERRKKAEDTIQGVLEGALKKLFKQEIRVISAGRTDKGVHAKGQVVNFKVNTQIPLKNMKRALNSFLPPDIRIKKIKRVSFDFHARFWAKSKIYRYIIFCRNAPSVFWKDFAWHIDKPLNLQNMEKASIELIGRKDFSLFAKEAKKYKDCTREIKDISLKKRGSFIYISVEANGFLRNMVRNIVSFLVKTGRGEIAPGDLPLILKQKIPYVNKPAPACGLYLCKVKYDKIV